MVLTRPGENHTAEGDAPKRRWKASAWASKAAALEWTVMACSLASRARFGLDCEPVSGRFVPPAMNMIRTALASALVALAATSCASTELTRETQTTGTFESTAWTVTILAIDIPKGALVAARENVNNMGLANAVVTETQVAPYLGWFDWFLDILSVRRARLRGTWGFEK